MRKQILFFLFFGLLFSITLYSHPQKQSEAPPERHEVTVSLVLVDVVATDKKGNFLTHLTKDDFEIYEDGKKVPINSLELISLIKEKIEEPVKEEQKSLDFSDREKRLIVIFDSVNTIKRVLEENKPKIIERLVSLIRIGREIMVFELTEKEGMKVLQPFSRDERLIAQTVQKASGSIWLDRETDHLTVPSVLEQTAKETAPKSLGGFGVDVDSFKASSTDIFQYFAQKRFDKTINGLLAAVNTIKDLPGRKSVLLISGGIPSLSHLRRFGLMTSKGKTVQFGDNVALSEVAAAKIDDPFRILKKSGIRRGEDIFKDFIHFANSYNITFYTLDPDNYLRYIMQDMAYENFPRSATNISLFDNDEIEEFKKSELNNLKNLAEDTGGASFMGAKKFENFQKVVNRDLSYSYELSFYPQRKKADGKYHKIDVRIKQPGTKVQFRKGYFDYTNTQRESLLFASASYNPALFKQISFEARAVPFVQGKNKIILWFNMALPVKGLILGEDEGQTLKKLKLNISIDDLTSERGVASRVNIPIILTPSFRRSLQKATFFGYNTCSEPLELIKDKYLMIFALYDENRRQMGTVEQMVEMPALGKKDAGSIVNVVFGNLVESLKGGQSPFTVSQKNGTLQLSKNAFYPMGLNQFRSRKNISLFLQAYSPLKQIAFESRFSFVKKGTESARVPAELVDQSWDKKAKVWNAVFNLDFSGFSQGEHVLRIRLIDPQTQKEIEKTLSIKII